MVKAFKILSTLGALLSVGSVIAAPPYLPNPIVDGNEWKMTFYTDNSLTHMEVVTHTLCFFPATITGTHQQFYWVSTSYPDWNGYASQEGDQIVMFGDFRGLFNEIDSGHDAFQWEIVTDSPNNSGTGHWQEWLEDGRMGSALGFGNAKFKRTGDCQYQTVEEAFEAGQNFRRSIDANNQPLSPAGASLKSN